MSITNYFLNMGVIDFVLINDRILLCLQSINLDLSYMTARKSVCVLCTL